MTGGRINRFNIVKQSKDYDQHGDYIRLWLPQLKDIPNEYIHEPWKLTKFQQIEYKVELGKDYPNPIISPTRSFTPRPDSSGNNNPKTTQKQRKPNQNRNNQGQKYEMKSVKPGGYQLK